MQRFSKSEVDSNEHTSPNSPTLPEELVEVIHNTGNEGESSNEAAKKLSEFEVEDEDIKGNNPESSNKKPGYKNLKRKAEPNTDENHHKPVDEPVAKASRLNEIKMDINSDTLDTTHILDTLNPLNEAVATVSTKLRSSVEYIVKLQTQLQAAQNENAISKKKVHLMDRSMNQVKCIGCKKVVHSVVYCSVKCNQDYIMKTIK